MFIKPSSQIARPWFLARKKNDPDPICNLLPRPDKHWVAVWNENKKEMQWLICGDKLYNALIKAMDELKEATFSEPIIVLKEPDGKIDAVLGQT